MLFMISLLSAVLPAYTLQHVRSSGDRGYVLQIMRLVSYYKPRIVSRVVPGTQELLSQSGLNE